MYRNKVSYLSSSIDDLAYVNAEMLTRQQGLIDFYKETFLYGIFEKDEGTVGDVVRLNP